MPFYPTTYHPYLLSLHLFHIAFLPKGNTSDGLLICSIPALKMCVRHIHEPLSKSSRYALSYRREDEDGGGAAGNAFVVVALYLSDVVAQVAAVVHPAVAAKRHNSELSRVATPSHFLSQIGQALYEARARALAFARTITFPRRRSSSARMKLPRTSGPSPSSCPDAPR